MNASHERQLLALTEGNTNFGTNPESRKKVGHLIQDLRATNELVRRNMFLRAHYDLVSSARLIDEDFIEGNATLTTLLSSDVLEDEERVILLETIIRPEDRKLFGLTPVEARLVAIERKNDPTMVTPDSTFIDWRGGNLLFIPGSKFSMRLDTSLPGIIYVVNVDRPTPDHMTHLREYLDIHGSSSVKEAQRPSLTHRIFNRGSGSS